MKRIANVKGNVKTRQWNLLALGLWLGAALMACAVDDGASPVEESTTTRPTPPAQKKEDAGVHVLGKEAPGDVGTQCEWWGCPPVPPCGDWICSPGEVNCPEDCGPPCGDGICSAGENSSNCPTDCPPPPPCGNGICSGGETYASCPADCPPPPPPCGDAACSPGEDANSCPTDCGAPGTCGNCICELNELSGCPTDCGVYIPNQPLCPQ